MEKQEKQIEKEGRKKGETGRETEKREKAIDKEVEREWRKKRSEYEESGGRYGERVVERWRRGSGDMEKEWGERWQKTGKIEQEG
jgi:hypothetical protein